MSKDNNHHTDCGSLTVPLEKLTQPAVLLLLAHNKAHGYELIQKLNQMEYIDGELEAATVYRTLRRMEQDGLIVSKWEHGEFGPARRQYELLDEGWQALDHWAGGLKARMKQIESFIVAYNDLRKQFVNKEAQGVQHEKGQ
jgi:poly-beta-hydroxybutyrate-responsive repressor